MNSSEAQLAVNVGSFSYKKGLPKDATEHGGGFVFDCRCITNPGREEKYRAKNGMDGEVIEFLERMEETRRFWSAVESLIKQAIGKYVERGFSYLSIQFGCTGGQHRSVYFAEKAAALVRSLGQTTVVVTHRDMPR